MNTKTIKFVAILLMVGANSCNDKTSNENLTTNNESIVKENTTTIAQQQPYKYEIPDFPYQKYLDSADGFPNIGDDGSGFDAISHKIRYPKLSDNIKYSELADSLLTIYNMTLAYNAFAYDLGTAEHYIDESTFITSSAHSLENFNLSGIKDATVRDLLRKMAQTSAKHLRKKQLQTEYKNTFVKSLNDCFNSYMNELLDNHRSDPNYSPSIDLENYADLHNNALSDSSFMEELTAMALRENDFKKKSILAYELAHSYQCANNPDYRGLVTIIDSILRSGEYSPLLRKLWQIWRTALQIEILSGISNDSAMYNLFYNDMRNKVAVTYINHLNTHPEDAIAFFEFIKLTMEYNIVRNCYKEYNNAIVGYIEAMPDLYKNK